MDCRYSERSKKKLEILLVLIIGEPGEFVSGIYAEILHVEKCFLMYISRFSLFRQRRLLLIDFLSYATIQSFEKMQKGREKCC